MASLVGQVDLKAVHRALQGPKKSRLARKRIRARLDLLKPLKGRSGPKRGETRLDDTGQVTGIWNGRRWITAGVTEVQIDVGPKKSKKSPPAARGGTTTGKQGDEYTAHLRSQKWCLRTRSFKAYCHTCRTTRVQTRIISPNGAWLQRCEGCGECDAVGMLVLKKRRVKEPVDNLVERNARLPKEVLKGGKWVEPTIGDIRPSPLGGIEIYDGRQWQRAKIGKSSSPKGITVPPPDGSLSFKKYQAVYDEMMESDYKKRAMIVQEEDDRRRKLMYKAIVSPNMYEALTKMDTKAGGWF